MEWPRTAITRFKISAPSGTSLTLNLLRTGNQNVLSGFFLPLEIQCFPVAEDWHSGTASTGWLRSATGTNARILANPAPLRNCTRNIKCQQWQTGGPKKLTTLPCRKLNCVVSRSVIGVDFSDLLAVGPPIRFVIQFSEFADC